MLMSLHTEMTLLHSTQFCQWLQDLILAIQGLLIKQSLWIKCWGRNMSLPCHMKGEVGGKGASGTFGTGAGCRRHLALLVELKGIPWSGPINTPGVCCLSLQLCRLPSGPCYLLPESPTLFKTHILQSEKHCLGHHLFQPHFTNGGKGNRIRTSWWNSHLETGLPSWEPRGQVDCFPGLVTFYYITLIHLKSQFWVSFPEWIQILIFPFYQGGFHDEASNDQLMFEKGRKTPMTKHMHEK